MRKPRKVTVQGSEPKPKPRRQARNRGQITAGPPQPTFAANQPNLHAAQALEHPEDYLLPAHHQHRLEDLASRNIFHHLSSPATARPTPLHSDQSRHSGVYNRIDSALAARDSHLHEFNSDSIECTADLPDKPMDGTAPSSAQKAPKRQ